MKNAILLFHASQLGDHLHPFLIDEIEHFQPNFDNVYVFCLKPTCSINEYENTNVHFVTIKLWPLYIRLWLLIPVLFTGYFWRDVRISIKNNIFGIQYLKATAMQIIYGRYFYKIANRLIHKSPKDEWVIDSYWLTGPAYAAALIKQKNNVIAYSRLHSSEADVKRNPIAICQLKGFIDKYMDFIFFVSDIGKQSYINIINKYYNPSIYNSDRYIVNRLGVKNNGFKSSPSDDGVYRILSCSRMVPLKRVSMLAEVFSKWNGPLIEWTHIGGGDDFEHVQSIVNHYRDNDNSSCILLGNLSHDDVINYYRNNKVDVFVNISQYEGLPVSIMEALSFGVPVIATKAGGTEEIVDNNDGILLEIDLSVDQLINAVLSLIELPIELSTQMRENAYQKYCELLNSEANFDVLLKKLERK